MLDDGACIYGAGVLLKHLQALEEEVTGVHAGHADIEFIHRARVASRRLRAALPLFETCLPQKKAAAWRKHIRSVTRALGEARDADVQIERVAAFDAQPLEPRFRPGVRRLLLRLRQKRQKLQPHVTRAMQKLLKSGVLAEMRERFSAQAARAETVYLYTPALYQHSFESITARLDDFLAYSAVVDQPEKVAELHEMRIQAKWLRYTIEAFAPLYSNHLKPFLHAVRKAQEQLGDIHDCDVWTAALPQFLAEERQRIIEYSGHAGQYKRLIDGVQCFLSDRQAARQAQYAEFVAQWQRWQQEDLWDGLRRAVQTPFPPIQAVYPPPPARPTPQ